jgi:hypothetical protein
LARSIKDIARSFTVEVAAKLISFLLRIAPGNLSWWTPRQGQEETVLFTGRYQIGKEVSSDLLGGK